MNFKKNIIFIIPKHRRRGIANVVTSAILLSAVSIMGAMLLVWSNTSLFSQQQEMEEIYTTQLNKINEDLSFENIWFATPSGNMTANHLNVTITNIGVLGLNVTSIQITNTTGTNNTSIDPMIITYGGIVKSGTLSLNVTYPWQTSDEIDVLVVTGRGNQFITQEIAP